MGAEYGGVHVSNGQNKMISGAREGNSGLIVNPGSGS